MSGRSQASALSWAGVVRLGLVQTALGAVVVLTTSTLNRIMVVEFALPAMLPAALVAWHYGVQLSRPRWGHGSDRGGRRTPFILAGMAALATGGVLAAAATIALSAQPALGLALGVAAFTLIGGGVGAAGTSLLALLASAAAPERRAAAAAIVWIMMIAGIVLTAGLAGAALEPFSPERLLLVSAAVSLAAMALAAAALVGFERRLAPAPPATAPGATFAAALREAWRDRRARLFTMFVFLSMLAYSMQELILEPFAGLAFGFTPGQSTQLAGVQNGGALLGMVTVGLLGGAWRRGAGAARAWIVGGCLFSAAALCGLTVAKSLHLPLPAVAFALGLGNGVFAVSAIGAMMGLAGEGGRGREGVRMGLWGAAQAIAMGAGGFLGAASVDALRAALGADAIAFEIVFAAEAALFVFAAALALRVTAAAPRAVDGAMAHAPGRLTEAPT